MMTTLYRGPLHKSQVSATDLINLLVKCYKLQDYSRSDVVQ